MKNLLWPGRLVLLGMGALALGEVNAEEEAQLPDGVNPCQEAKELIDAILQRHYRGVGSPEELSGRLNRAFRRWFYFIQLQRRLTTEQVATQFSIAEPLALNQGGESFGMACPSLQNNSEPFVSGITSQMIWNAVLNAFLSELDPHSRIVHDTRAPLPESDLDRYSEIQYVNARDLPEEILYLQLTSFGRGSSEQLEEAIELRPNARGVILDLRFNGGGLLEEARRVVDLFIDLGMVASAWNREGKASREMVYLATTPGYKTVAPLVVLVNDGSASASEVVAQAIQDHGRGIVVGRRTWGKGSVQRVYPLTARRYLVLTQYMYHTMSGVSPQGIGVTPDVYAPDPILERYLASREVALVTGEEVGPMRESEIPYALPTVPRLNAGQRAAAGGEVDSNPIGAVMAQLPPAAFIVPSIQTEDPALKISQAIVSAYAARCENFRAESCQGNSPLIAAAR